MPSSSLILSIGTILSALSSPVLATKYSESESFTASNWLDAFKFETYDLNNGFVNYVTEATAKSSKLYKIESGDVMFGVDATETLDYKKMPGRKSVRLEGTKNYNKGLFVLDVKAIPGVCGMWPAFWSIGQEPWPVKGEIDIIEGVNDNKANKYVLHTDTKCKVDGLGQTAAQGGKDCALDGANGPSGCDVNEGRSNSFGPGFNANGGGYYVMEWDSDAIKMWFFPRGGGLPKSLTTRDIDTSEFGTPAANFKGDCNLDTRFKDQRFIFNEQLLVRIPLRVYGKTILTQSSGDWASNAYAASGCPMQKDAAGKALNGVESCKKYVAENPQVFANQFWKISSFKTYKKKSVSSSSSVSMSKTSSMVSSSTKISSSASSTKVSSSVSSAKVSSSASSTKVSSSSSHIASSSVHARSSAHVTSSASSSVHASISSSVSSSVHMSVSAHLSSDVHSASSASSDIHSSSDAHSSTPIGHVSSSSDVHGSSTYYPPGQTSSAVYPLSSGGIYPGGLSSSSSASIHYYGNFSAPVSHSVPAYAGSSSVPVYGGSLSIPIYGGDAYLTPAPPKSTPCTTSSAKGASSTPGYPVYPNSVPNYGDYPSYPVSSPVKNNYPYLPEFTPVTPVYPPTTSKATYDDYYQPPVSKTTITTTYTTTYIDVCETGYITKSTTFAVTYCPTTTPTVPTPGKPNNPPTYGWDVTKKVCQYGCGEGPKTVTVTVPCTKCDLSKSTPTPAVPNKPSCNGANCKVTSITTKVYQTKIITLTKSPVPEAPKSSPHVYGDKPNSKPVVPEPPKSEPPIYGDKPSSKPAVPEAPKSTPVVSKPNEPAKSTPIVSKPATPSAPVYGNKNNGTISISIGTGVKPTPSKTGYAPPVFTGAAASVQAGGFVAVLGVAAAFFL